MSRTQIITLLLALTTLLWSCDAGEEASTEEEQLVKVVNVKARTITPEDFRAYVKLVGNIDSDNDIRVSSEANGRVLRYFVEKGQRVQKGDRILKIDDEQLVQDRERLEAMTNQARENYERLKRIFEEDSVGSEIDVLNAKYNYQQTKASLEATKVQIRKTEVRAPFNAVLEQKLVEEGEMASMGTPLFRIISSERLKVNVGVPSRYADVIQPGDPTEIWFDTQESDTLEAPIVFVGNSIDPLARTFQVEIAIPNKMSYKMDMLANVRLQTMAKDSVRIVGQEYIYQQDDGSYAVYVAGQSNGKSIALKRAVTIGPMFRNSAVVTSGLNFGDRLLTVGSSFLQDSMRVNVTSEGASNLAQLQE